MSSRHQKEEMARVAMDTKRKLERPMPARVHAKLPRLSLNPETEAPASDWTIYKIVHHMCYDEREDDPWIYIHFPSKDFLSDDMKTAVSSSPITFWRTLALGHGRAMSPSIRAFQSSQRHVPRAMSRRWPPWVCRR